MLRKVKGGWVVMSSKKHGGKRRRLSRVYKSKHEAHVRLGQIEWFKKNKR